MSTPLPTPPACLTGKPCPSPHWLYETLFESALQSGCLDFFSRAAGDLTTLTALQMIDISECVTTKSRNLVKMANNTPCIVIQKTPL